MTFAGTRVDGRPAPGAGSGPGTAFPPGLAAPEEIAGAVVYLSSDAARMVTGHTLAVDTGRIST